MADIAAPYTTAQELTTPAQPELGGLGVDVSNKNPFGIFGQSILQLGEKEAQKEQQRRQQIFENQQQERRFQNDASARIQSYALQDSLNQSEANRKFIQQVYNDNKSGLINTYNHTDEQGNPTSFTPPAGHMDQLLSQAKEITDAVHKSPQGANDPDVMAKFAQLQAARSNSGAAAAQLAALKVRLAQTSDPTERENIQKGIDDINNSSVNTPVKNYTPTPLDIKLLPEGAEIDKMVHDKSMQSVTDENDNQKLAIPVSYVAGIPSLQPNTPEWRKMQNTVNLFKGTTPGNTIGPDIAATDPTKFSQLQQDANTMADIYHIPRPNLGQVVTDQNGKSKIVLNPDDRQVAYGINLQKAYFNLKDDPDAPSDLDVEEQKAKIAKDKAEAAGKGGKKTAEQLKEDQNREAVRSTYNDVQKLLTPPPNVKPLKVTYFGSGYDVYPIPQGQADKYIGIEAPVTTTTTKSEDEGGKKDVKETSAKGTPYPSDAAFLGINKKTGEREIAFIKDQKIVATVPEKQLVVNGLKADAKFEPSQYGNKTIHVDEIYGNKGQTNNEVAGGGAKTTTLSRPTNLPDKSFFSSKLKVWIDPTSRKSYDANGKLIPTK